MTDPIPAHVWPEVRSRLALLDDDQWIAEVDRLERQALAAGLGNSQARQAAALAVAEGERRVIAGRVAEVAADIDADPGVIAAIEQKLAREAHHLTQLRQGVHSTLSESSWPESTPDHSPDL